MEIDSFDQVKAVLQYHDGEEPSDAVMREEEDALMRRVAEHLQSLHASTRGHAGEPTSPPYTPAAGSPPPLHRVHFKKPMPCEVWRAQWGVEETRAAALPPKVMRQQDWQRFFRRVKQTADRRESRVQRGQNAKLAEELRALSFRPELNPHSRALGRKQRPILERQGEHKVRREEQLCRQREEKAEKEMAECTFAPTLAARGRSEQYLRRAARAGRTVDFNEFLTQKRVRRERRQRAMEDAQARGLTFTPHLTRMTRWILERARREGRDINRRAGRRAGAQGGQGEGRGFEPQLTPRSARYTSQGGGDVHARLYASALDKGKGFRAQPSDSYTKGLSLSRSRKTAGEAGGPQRSGGGKGERGVPPAEPPVLNVVRFDARFEGIMRRVFPWTKAWAREGW